MANKKISEAEFLDREILLAKEALAKVRDETLDSLKRSADPLAWTEHYPWPSLGTAAVAGVGAGWVAGRAMWGEKRPAKDSADDVIGPDETRRSEPERPHAAARMVGGLGTMVGALVSGIVGAATQSIVEVVKETVRETLKPEMPPEPTANGHHEDSVNR
jgi:hypothetical protein